MSEGGDGESKHGMDEISAHLDRGWTLVQEGELDTAEISARKVLELDEESPEGHTLLGAIRAARGETDEALEAYARAMKLDPEFVDPILYAAETYIWPLEDYERAVELCDRALEVAEEEDEYVDALLLKAEAQAADDDGDGAAETLDELPPTDFPDPHYHLRAGRTWLDLGELDKAEAQLKRALARQPDLVDARHALGLVYEEREDDKAMVDAFMVVREADLKEPSPPWALSQERFDELAEQALGKLPDKIRKLLENVPIIASDYPSAELVADGHDPRMMGFFAGVPYPEKSVEAAPHLDQVFLYQRNIERVCRSADEVEEEIEKTLLHETGHFFGLSEEELDEMGLA